MAKPRTPRKCAVKTKTETAQQCAKIRPWKNNVEYCKVRDAIFSTDYGEKKWGFDKIQVWKRRTHPALPACIDATLYLLRAELEDMQLKNHLLGDLVGISVFYSMALVRFVNVISELAQNRCTAISVSRAGEKLGIPDWIVNLRHAATHSNLPSLDMLQDGARFALQWLHNEYWMPLSVNSEDAVYLKPTNMEKGDLEASIKVFKKLQYSFLQFTRSATEDKTLCQEIFNILKRMRMMLIQNSVEFFQVLLKPSVFFLSREDMFDLLTEEEYPFITDNSSYELPLSLLKFWAPLIDTLNSCNEINKFVEQLLMCHTSLDPCNQRTACAWVYKFMNTIQNDELDESDPIHAIYKKNGWILNWRPLSMVCVMNPSMHMLAMVIPLLEHVVPPLSPERQLKTAALLAVILGVLPPMTDTVDEIKHTREEIEDYNEIRLLAECNIITWQPVKIWNNGPTDIDWASIPLGHVFGSESDFLGSPRKMELTANTNADDPLPMVTEESNHLEDRLTIKHQDDQLAYDEQHVSNGNQEEPAVIRYKPIKLDMLAIKFYCQ